MQAVVLTYHSHRVLGHDYATNDHVALARDLESIEALGLDIVPLRLVVDVARGLAVHGKDLVIAVTFDDGPLYDLGDFDHPQFGLQRGFLGILSDFRATHGKDAQPQLCATSFVIASPDARKVMEHSYDDRFTYLGPDSMGDAWWNTAIDSGLIDIANHSFDHLHPALPKVAHSRQTVADFTAVSSTEDADAQIRTAQGIIAQKTRGRNVPYFAYPFGHFNTFLAHDYLPRPELGISAAFTTEPRRVTKGDHRWALPRFVCGEHWRDPDSFKALLLN